MKTKLFIRFLALLTAAVLSISAVGCKTPANSDDNLKGNQSLEDTSSDVDTSSDSDDQSTDDTESDYIADYDDYLPDDENYYFYETVNVKNSSAPVQSDFLGFNTVQHCFTYIKDDYGRNYTESQAQTEFNRLKNMGIDIVRTYYNEEYAFDPQTGGFDFESDNMKGVYKWMLEMQKRDISVALNTGWAIDGAYKEDYWVAWKGCYVDGDIEATVKNHTDWVVESLKQFRAHGINNIDYLIMFTEPGGDNSEIDTDKLAETYLKDAYDLDPHVDLWLKASRSIHDALVKNGTRGLYKTVGPNTHNNFTSKNPDTLMAPLYYFAIKYASDFIDIYSHHRYVNISAVENDTVSDTLEYTLLMQENIDAAHNIGKEFWYDEAGVANPNFRDKNADHPIEGLHIASYFGDTMNRGVQNMFYWYVFDQQWPNNTTTNADQFTNGLHHCGFIPSLMDSYIPQAAYYSASLLTKYFGNNATVYQVERELEYFNCGVQQDKNGEWSICISNLEMDPGYVEINFEKSIGNKKFYRHVYKAGEIVPTKDAEIIPADRILTTKGDRLIDRLEPHSMVVYTTIAD